MIKKFIDWQDKKRILIMLAHPDDPEFFCGGSIAKWIASGHEVHYWLFTRGEKGCDPSKIDCSQTALIREGEQKEAAKELGALSVKFGNFHDGELIPCLEARMEVVKAIRTVRPDVIITCDYENRFHRNNALNHPDHLYAGINVLDALFPASNNSLYFPSLINRGLRPHSVKELWLSITRRPNIRVDISKTIMSKLRAIHKHISQVGKHMDNLDERILARFERNFFFQKRYYETYFRIIF